MTVRELIEALSGLDPELPVVADVVDNFEPGEMIPVDVAIKGYTARSNVPDGYYVFLRPLEDWLVMADYDEES